MDKKSYRIDEVAKEFDVSPSTVKRWIASGEIDSIRIGHTRRIMSETIAEVKKKGGQFGPNSAK